jgi:hypothetical protein
MPIEIIKQDPIRITQEQYDRYVQEWNASSSMTTNPVSFETFVRRREAEKHVRKDDK